MSNHTPGPWCAQKARGGWTIRQLRKLGSIPKLIGHIKSDADADLICAAPDMLEALQHVLGELDVKGISLAVRYHVEDAIAKAQGEVTT